MAGLHRVRLRRTLPLVAVIWLAVGCAVPAAAQDEISDRIRAQQEEEARLNQQAAEMNRKYLEEEAAHQAAHKVEYAPNIFITPPPDAWYAYVKREREQHDEQVAARFANDPRYAELQKGVWTYGADPERRVCVATFWARYGGVTFVHIGGEPDLTYLGFFGAGIPQAADARTIPLELIQSGEVQRVRALNIRFGDKQALGMVLLKVPRADILLGAIEDRQDFEVKFEGKQIAYGEWNNGLKAREQLRSCLQGQGYATGR